MSLVAITGTGLYVPPHKISNEELVESFNQYVDQFNQEHEALIAQGQIEPLAHSSASFIEKASGIRYRHVIDKKGILDPQRMRPFIPAREDDAPSVQCEIACHAILQALDEAQKKVNDVDGLIVSCANLQRAYPAIAIEVQHALGIQGYAFDMNVACSSTTFAIATAYNALAQNQNRCIVVVNPEVTTAHVNFRDRDSHFIFGDICTAVVIERETEQNRLKGFEILGAKLSTDFSNNIRNNFGFLNQAEMSNVNDPFPIYLFKQNGRKVFKEVVPLVEAHILSHLEQLHLKPKDIKRFWLHQANVNMNELIIKKILGRAAESQEAPLTLQEYGNTASAGSLVAFHHYHQDLLAGDLGLICSFGAGYSIGSLVVKKM